MKLNSGTRTENVSKNVMSGTFNKVVMLLLTFITRKLFIQYIGVEFLGINGLFSNVLTLLSMADLGLGTAMNVSLYRPIANNDTDKISALLNYYKKLYYFIAVGVTIVGLCVIPFLDYIVNLKEPIQYLPIYYIVFLSNTVVSYLFIYKSSIINADQKNYLINKVSLYVTIFKVVIQCVSIIIFHNYLIFIIMEVIATLVNNLIISYIANKQYPFIKKGRRLEVKERKEIFANMYSMFIYKIAFSMLNGTDNILISIICGTAFVGLYANYYTITFNLEMFIVILFSSLTASVGNLVATSNEEKRYQTFNIMQLCSFWISGVFVVCLFFLMQDFIILWLGKEYLFDSLTLYAIILNVYFSICMRPVWTFREGTGMYSQIKYIMVFTAILNLILSIILGKIIGIAGILFGTTISKICTYFWYEPSILYKNFFNKRIGEYYFGQFKNIITLIIGLIFCSIPISFFNEVSFINWFFKGLICLIIMNIIYIIANRNSNEFIYLKNIFFSIIAKMKHRL